MRRLINLNSTIMSKNKHKKAQLAEKADKSNPKSSVPDNEPIYLDKKGNMCIRIMAKPGAKQNAVTNIDEEGVHVQIAAPPTEGEANAELVKFLSNVLDLRKSDVSLEKGSRSRNKIVMVENTACTLETIRNTLNKLCD